MFYILRNSLFNYHCCYRRKLGQSLSKLEQPKCVWRDVFFSRAGPIYLVRILYI